MGKPNATSDALTNWRREVPGCCCLFFFINSLSNVFALGRPRGSLLSCGGHLRFAHGPEDAAANLIDQEWILVMLFFMAQGGVEGAAALEFVVPGQGHCVAKEV